MNIQLNQTDLNGQTWKYKISNGKNYNVYSSSEYLLYELTDNSLVITARKEAQDGDNIVLVNGELYTTYTLNKIEPQVIQGETYTVYYGNGTEVPATYTGGQSKTISDGEFEFVANNQIAWFALPKGLNVVDVIETMFGTSWIDDIPEMKNAVEVGDYRMYHIAFGVTGVHTTNLKITYTK